MVITADTGADGFGNEFIKIAKVLVCREALGIPVAPAYWRSPYRMALPRGVCYSSRWRNACCRVAAVCRDFRRIDFGPEDHSATGLVPVEEAFARFLAQTGIDHRGRTEVVFKGITPGLESVERHGLFLRNLLLSVPVVRASVEAAEDRFDRRKLTVGVHVRRGDFRPALPLGTDWPAGKWNIQVPLEWYEKVCDRLAQAFPGRVQFVVSANETDDELVRLCRKHDAWLIEPKQRRSAADVVDLLSLASCDVLISSPSWFSGWAVVLKPKPWLWYACAHGMPLWGRHTGFLYADAEGLPEGFLTRAEDVLIRRLAGESEWYGSGMRRI